MAESAGLEGWLSDGREGDKGIDVPVQRVKFLSAFVMTEVHALSQPYVETPAPKVIIFGGGALG